MHCVRPVLKKQPNPYESPEGAPFIVIGPKSPLSYHRAIFDMASDFANSVGYSTPYDVGEAYRDPSLLRDRILLFVEPRGTDKTRCFGAIGFRWGKKNDLPNVEWFMTWVWFHPKEQRKGHLTAAWPHILKLYPVFVPVPPLSHGMQSFLKKRPEILESFVRARGMSATDVLSEGAQHCS